MKIFIFSTHLTGIDLPATLSVLKNLPEGSLIRTSGSKGLDSHIPSLPDANYEVYVPWNKFNNYDCNEDSRVICPSVTKTAIDILSTCILGELKPKYVKIDNRLVQGILGKDLNSPVDLIIINNIDSTVLPTTSSALVERLGFNNGIRSINLEYTSSDDLDYIINNFNKN
jgi:hypothetical protein